REKDDEDAMPYDVIKSATYKKWIGAAGVDEAKKLANQRVAQDSTFSKILQNTEWLGARNEKNYTLNLKEYLEERKNIESKVKGIEGIVKLKSPLNVVIEKSLELTDSTNKVAYERTKLWAKSISEDIYVNQAVKSIYDLQKSMRMSAATKND
ncbi:MAG: tail-specific protease, partial [Chitinophagaceae bacterium]